MLIAVGFGLCVGLFLGYLVAYVGVNPFISTLGVATLLGGAIFAYTGGLQITYGIPAELTDIGSRDIVGIPPYRSRRRGGGHCGVVDHVEVGLRPSSLRRGLQPAGTQLLGVDVRRIQLLSFVASGTIAGLAGVMLLARQGAATSDSGMTMLFPALTAVLLSTIVIDIGRPSVPGTIIGILFIAVSVSGLTLVGAPSWVSQVFNGAALLIAVGFARLARLRSARR